MRSPANRTWISPDPGVTDLTAGGGGAGHRRSGRADARGLGRGSRSRRRAARPATSARSAAGRGWGTGPRAAGPAQGCSARALTPGRTVRRERDRDDGAAAAAYGATGAAHMNGDRFHTPNPASLSRIPFFGVLAGWKICRWVPRRFRCRGWSGAAPAPGIGTYGVLLRSAAVWSGSMRACE